MCNRVHFIVQLCVVAFLYLEHKLSAIVNILTFLYYNLIAHVSSLSFLYLLLFFLIDHVSLLLSHHLKLGVKLQELSLVDAGIFAICII